MIAPIHESLQSRTHSERGITRTDVLCLAGALTLLASVSLPLLGGLPVRENRILCANNLQIAGVALQAWANDHGDNLPWQVSYLKGGSNGKSQTYEHWVVLSNYLDTPQILACPATSRKPAQRFNQMRDAQVSYLIGSDSDLMQPGTFVSADFDIQGGSESTCSLVGRSATVVAFPGSFLNPEAFRVSWSRTNHVDRGNTLSADGGVRQVDSRGLRKVLASSTDSGNNSHSLMPR